MMPAVIMPPRMVMMPRTMVRSARGMWVCILIPYPALRKLGDAE